ncbi:hypothetical protein [Bradyrhizobium canariense]|uniref:hypothetical protein n=1 Tax=Bradyrhizobium canariense TaxID=255045 RepID=UPI0011BACA79|nr:hypothetical protein [Bradyrhizobium canariense]
MIGHILASFGEIEVTACYNTAIAHKLINHVLAMLYGLRATSPRIEAALRLMVPAAEVLGLQEEQKIVTPMIWHCVSIRNQYAHCNWGDEAEPDSGVYFADLQNSAKNTNFSHDWKHVDIELLQKQLDYFNATMEMLNFINGEINRQAGRVSENPFPRPPIPTQPPLHNPPLEHVPQWIDETEKALHVAKAQAALGGPPTPTPSQLELDRARAAKKEARRLHAERSAKGSSSPEGNQPTGEQ